MKPVCVVVVLALFVPGGCQKEKEVQTDLCLPPAQATPSSPASYAGQLDLARSCIKSSVYTIARKGGPIEAVAQAAVGQCADHESDVIAALRKTGPVYPYQTTEVHEDLVHLAKVTAVRARAKGCGADADTLLQSRS